MVLGGTSKSNKTWVLLHMGLCVAAGADWLGYPTARCKVLYVNFELQDWAVQRRIMSIVGCNNSFVGNAVQQNFDLWNLRGHAKDFALMRDEIEKAISETSYGLIILDPAYKLLGDRDENSNGEIASLFNEFEKLCQKSGAALVLAHHYAKGNSSEKESQDRMSGAGSWVRDPDSIMVMTPHQELDCFTISPTLRNFPRVNEFVVEWRFPTMHRRGDLNPADLKGKKGKKSQ